MTKQVEQALDECLELLAQGWRVEACLARYPELAGELEPLLRVAARGQRVLGSPHPTPQARAVGKAKLLTALAERREKPRKHWLAFLPRGLAVALASLLVVLLGAGTVAASWRSLPGQPLYAVKQATENARLALTPSRRGKAKLLVRLVEARMEEIRRLEEVGDIEGTERLRHRMGRHLGRVKGLAIGMEREEAREVIALMRGQLTRHQQRLAARGFHFRAGVKAAPGRMPPLPQGAPPPVPAPTPLPTAMPAPHPAAVATPAAERAAEAMPSPTPTPPSVTPTPPPAPRAAPLGPSQPPPPALHGLAGALRDYQKALQELLREIEKRERRPPGRG